MEIKPKEIILYPNSEGQFTFKPEERENLLERRAKPQKHKPTYPQDWSAYNEAKTNEDIFFKKLIQELLFLILEEEEHKGVGRKPFSNKEKIFALCIKTYYKSDLRKCQSILKELKNLHYLD